MPVTVEGELVVLRPKKLEDAANDYAWRSDPELAALDAAVPIVIGFPEYQRYHRDDLQYPSPWSVRFGIDTKDGRHIGNCMYYDIDPERRQAEMGIMIGDRAYWGRGYGKDAVRTLIGHIFMSTPLTRVYLHTLKHNERAQKSFTSAGFRSLGEVRRDGFSFIKMEIVRDEWVKSEGVEGEPEGGLSNRGQGQHEGLQRDDQAAG